MASIMGDYSCVTMQMLYTYHAPEDHKEANTHIRTCFKLTVTLDC